MSFPDMCKVTMRQDAIDQAVKDLGEVIEKIKGGDVHCCAVMLYDKNAGGQIAVVGGNRARAAMIAMLAQQIKCDCSIGIGDPCPTQAASGCIEGIARAYADGNPLPIDVAEDVDVPTGKLN